MDTGVEISVISYANEPSAEPALFKLQAANSSTSDSYRDKTLTLNIKTNDQPAHSHLWQFTPHKLAYTQKQFNEMLNHGIICPSNSNLRFATTPNP